MEAKLARKSDCPFRDMPSSDGGTCLGPGCMFWDSLVEGEYVGRPEQGYCVLKYAAKALIEGITPGIRIK